MYGHGTFIYYPEDVAMKFGSYDKAATAMRKMGMHHAWIRLHGSKGLWKIEENCELIKALKAQGIAVFGWGWCDGNDVERNIANVRNCLKLFDVDGYVADIEADEQNVRWTADWLELFCRDVRELLGQRPFLISTYGFLPYHQPELIKIADPYVDAFAPQVYWFNFPKSSMLDEPGAVGSYRLNDAASYASLCIDVWRHVVSKPLVLTGQCYWGEAQSWDRALAEEKLREFIAGFDRYADIVGLNWWHLAGMRAMSDRMMKLIREARFDEKIAQADPEQASLPVKAEPAKPVSPDWEKAIVSGDGLRVRSKPGSAQDETILVSLNLGLEVNIVGPGSKEGWVRVVVELRDRVYEGEVLGKFLRPAETPQVEALLCACVREWIRFERGRGAVQAGPYRRYIRQMWEARHYHWDGVSDLPWSAAFLSWVVQRAGYKEFAFGVRHGPHIQQAIHRREIGEDGPFWGYRLKEHKPQLGDVICIDESGMMVDYDYAEDHDCYSSQCQIVVQVRSQSIRTIGGNSGQEEFGHSGSVAMRTWRLNSKGYLKRERGLFAILRNRLA